MSKDTDFILNTMQWSYSRLTAYNQCAYSFFLRYVQCNEGDENFFSQYGSFVHKILEKYEKGELSLFELCDYYEENYRENVPCPAPPNNYVDVVQSYYDKGLDFLENIDLNLESFEILGVEKKVEFTVGKYKMVGFIDLLLKDKKTGEITVLDHKSGSLKIKKNGDISKSDEEHFKSFKRQLYLYSVAVINEYGVKPKYLKWNLFKDKSYITIDFDDKEFEEAKQWVLDTIHTIEKDTQWLPNPDYYFCHNLCDMRNCACEYKP